MDFLKHQPFVDLNGEWQFAYAFEPPAEPATTAEGLRSLGLELRPCQVPGNFELDLHAAGLIEEPFFATNIIALRKYEHAHVWYTRRFAAAESQGQTAELVFEGVDCFAEIYLNGQHLLSCDNMLVAHIACVDGLLREENELVVHIRPAVEEAKRYPYPPTLGALDLNYESLYVRKAPHMYGWDIMPRAVSAGLWRPVKLRFRPGERLEEVFLETTSIAADGAATLALHYRARTHGGPGDNYELALEGACGESRFYQRLRMPFEAGRFLFTLPGARLWWPRGRGQQHLYEVTATLLKSGLPLDVMTFRHGIRTIALARTSVTTPEGDGEFCFYVNGERFFALGTNWVPADAYHSRDRARLPAMLALADDLGCNMIRCWGGNVYEDDLFYEYCDERGILVWQDFALACAIYPQDAEFRARLEREARAVVKRLRQHPCLALWAGDNECDFAYSWFGRRRDPNTNALTRELLPGVLREEDETRPYLPSSPYMDEVAFQKGDRYLPEHHLWGPRDYYKSAFYRDSLCHFASEIGYHGCPSPESVRRFISLAKVWPYQDNEEWVAHATIFAYRVELMAKQIRELFGEVPDNLDEFAFASQASQAEAKKFFIELFRTHKWRRTGILWWNLIDGWPQFSDAVVDYYFVKKLAYGFIKRAQQPLLIALREPENWGQDIIACNDTRSPAPLRYTIRDLDRDQVMAAGEAEAAADVVTVLGRLPFSMGEHRCYLIEWESPVGLGRNHYLAGNPPFSLEKYRAWLGKAGLLEG